MNKFIAKHFMALRFVVEVGHLPTVLLVVVVVSVGGVVRRGDALGIRGRGAVVEVHLNEREKNGGQNVFHN